MATQRRKESRHEACSGVEEEKMDRLTVLGESCNRGVQEGAKGVLKAKWSQEQQQAFVHHNCERMSGLGLGKNLAHN